MNVRFTRSRIAAAALAAAGTLALGISMAEAAVGGGRSFGSRGGNTFKSAPATPTAPKSSDTIQRSTTQPGQIAPGAAARPGTAGSAVAGQTARRGFGSLLMGGLIGAGLFGLLSGAGLFGGLSGLAGFLGLMLQFALIAGIVWLGLAFWRSRSQPAAASANAGMQRASLDPNAGRPPMNSYGGMGGGQPAGPQMQPLEIGPQDYQTFERLLGEIQAAFGRGDVPALRMRATPEMAGYLSEDLAANAEKGVRNEISDVKLLQGDLSEAWSEPDADYATVAMRFGLIDVTVETASGRIVEGSRTEPREITEVWTFRRSRGGSAGGWKLSAIQQVQ